MSEHLIRLRGGWNWPPDPSSSYAQGDGNTSEGEPVTLPHSGPWPGGRTGRVYLTRSFGQPRFDPGSEMLSLRLERVAGLLSVQLNEREIARPDPGTDILRVPLDGPLPRRNRLTLLLDLSTAGSSPVAWGEIALVIAGRG